MSTSNSLWVRQLGSSTLSVALVALMGVTAMAQDGAPVSAGFEPEIPSSYSGSGSFFNRSLGTALRFDYRTRGYGTEDGVVSIGGMKVISPYDGATWFIDGQGTLSEDFGGGFNLGVGHRVLADVGMGFDTQRIHGLGFWVDGQSTNADNFFTQLGFSAESLGESFDVRLNGHFPLEDVQEGDPVITSLDALTYIGNNLFEGTQEVAVDSSVAVVDGEIAKRIMNLDAWAYGGVYALDGNEMDTTGYRIGVRGYAVHDLAVSLQVTDDDYYDTNVMFGITWFVGRTHRGNMPCGTIVDRFREPVLRNNFIAMMSRLENRPISDALTDTETSEIMRIVHVDSNAPAGGDGTFENPFNRLSDADGVGSMTGDKILVHAESNFTGADGTFIAKADQDIFGEGADADGNAVSHLVDTVELGIVSLPETSAGAASGIRPVITDATDPAFTMADNNKLNNFEINGGTRAVFASGVESPQLGNLDINTPGGDAIVLDNVFSTTGQTLIENTVVIDDAIGTAIRINGGEDLISIAAEINDSTGRVMDIQNRTGGTVAFTGTVTDNVDDGTIFSEGILIANNTDSTFNFTGMIDLDTEDITALDINSNNGDDGSGNGSSITFSNLIATSRHANTVEISDGGIVNINASATPASITNTGTEDAVHIAGDTMVASNNAVVNIGANIVNEGGGNALDIHDRSANDVTISGNVTGGTGGSQGINIENNSDGTIAFTGAVDIDTSGVGNNAFTMTDNEGATVTATNLQLSSTMADALSVEGGGTLTVTDPLGTNEIRAINSGTAVNIVGNANGDAIVTIDAEIASDTSARSVVIQDRTSNDVTFNGTILDEGDGLLIEDNSGGNILFTNTVTTNTETDTGIDLNNNGGTTLSFNGLDITTTSGKGFRATGGGDLIVTSPAGTNTINTESGIALELINMTIDPANVTFDTVNVTAGTNEGIILNNLGGTGQVVIGGGTLSTSNTAISINNIEGLLMTGVTVDNSTAPQDGAGLEVQGVNSGTLTFNGLDITTRSATAVNVHDNSGGTIAFNNLTAETNNGGDAVFLMNNSGATLTFNGMEATATGNGNGFSATGGGTLTATGTNTIDVQQGVGLNINGLTISNSNATFESVNVTNGSTNGIVLTDTTGSGQIRVGGAFASGTDGDGGTLDTDNTAILLTGVENAIFNDITINNSASATESISITHTLNSQSDVTFDNLTLNTTTAGVEGIVVRDSGIGEMDIIVQNSIINTTNAVAFELITENNSGEIDVSIVNNPEITSGNASAILANLNNGTGDVQFLISGNDDVSNNSLGSATVSLTVDASRTLNATIGDQDSTAPFDDNTFRNSNGGGTAVSLTSVDALSRLNLDLRGNLADGGAEDFFLTETGGQFGVVERTDTITNETNNQGTVNLGGGGVEADFDDLVPPIKQVD